MTTKRILITGAGGFIGRHLFESIGRSGTCVIGTDRKAQSYPWNIIGMEGERRKVFCDLTAEPQVASLMLRLKPDVVFHLAGNAIVKEGQDPTAVTRANVLSTHNLLAYAPEGCRFLLASSATVYGTLGQMYRCRELDHVYATSAYAASKIAAEALVEAYTNQNKVRGTSLRLVANVGAYATHGVVHDFIRKLRSNNSHLDVLGDEPGSLKPYIHVNDTLSAMRCLGLEEWTDQVGPFNISPHRELTIAEVAWCVMQGLGITKPIKWLGASANWKGDQNIVRVNSNRLMKLGWRPTYTSDEAIITAVQECVQCVSL